MIDQRVDWLIWMQANLIAKFKAAWVAADVDCDGFDMKCAKVKMEICDGKP